MPQRKNKSRSKELDIVLCEFKNQKNNLKHYLTSNKEGGTYLTEDKSFTYGNISRIVNHINWSDDFNNPTISNIVKIYHLDSLSKEAKTFFFLQNQIPLILLSPKFKPDLLVIDVSNKHYLISFKDGTSVSKLGQVSARINYHFASLKGGHQIEKFDFSKICFPKDLIYSATDLNQDQFSKLTDNDKKLAFIKKNFPDEWRAHVNKCLNDANNQLVSFKKNIINNKLSFIYFITLTLFGRYPVPSEYCILINETLIFSDSIVKFLEQEIYQVTCKDYYTENKFSLLVELHFNNTIYGITKIEPAFDGKNTNVSQTKGIIFYFQEYSVESKNIWRLLKDIPK
jgi:hypothetical protein